MDINTEKLYNKTISKKYKKLLNNFVSRKINQESFDLNISMNLLEDLNKNKFEYVFKIKPQKPKCLEDLSIINPDRKDYEKIVEKTYNSEEFKNYISECNRIEAFNYSTYQAFKNMHNGFKSNPEYKECYLQQMQDFEIKFFGYIKTY